MIRVKGVVVFFLILALSLSIFMTTVFAAEGYTIGLRDANQNATIIAEAGDKVEAYLYLSGNPGILTAGVLVECPKGISIMNAQSALSGQNFTPVWQFSKNYTANPYLVWMLAPMGTNEKALVTYNGNWCKITFTLAEDIAVGEYTIQISAPKDKNLTAETKNGVIKANTNTYVENITVTNLKISVQAPVCNHDWGNWTEKTPATCLETGQQIRECSICHTVQTQDIDAIGHDMGNWTRTVKPSCSKEGSEKRTCQNAGCQYSETRPISKLEHQFGKATVTKAATCKQAGVKTSICTLCKEKKTEKIKKLLHKFSDPKVIKEPTCTEDGEQAGICNNCKESTTEIVPAIGHTYGEVITVKQATCEAEGTEKKVCQTCNDEVKTQLPALGHDFADAVVVRQPTEELPGLQQSKCTRCEAVEEAEIPYVAKTEEGTQDDKTVLVLASVLLLGVILTAVIVACSRKKQKV